MPRIWALPTFEVHGIAGGYQGPGLKTVVPPRATAIVSARLVPDMEASRVVRQVKAWVRKKNPDVKGEVEASLPAYIRRSTGAHPDAIRSALRCGFGKRPAVMRAGAAAGAGLSRV